jgi:hypothetical protein
MIHETRLTLAAALMMAAANPMSPTRAMAEAPVETAADIRVVPCDAPVRSYKRGVCANELHPEDFKAFAPGVSWWYNWYFKPGQTPPPGVTLDFVPMVWGDRPEDIEGLAAYLETGVTPRQVMILNEPNLKGQAFISPERTAEVYKQAKAIGSGVHLHGAVRESLPALHGGDRCAGDRLSRVRRHQRSSLVHR